MCRFLTQPVSQQCVLMRQPEARAACSLAVSIFYLHAPWLQVNSRPMWSFLEAHRHLGLSTGERAFRLMEGVQRGAGRVSYEKGMGRASGQVSSVGRAKHVRIPWCAGEGRAAGCGWSVSPLPNESFQKPGLGPSHLCLSL